MRRLLLVMIASGLLVLVSLFAAPGNLPAVQASSGSPDKIDMLGEPGPYAVGFTSFTVVDNSRPGAAGYDHRPIPVYLFYPVDNASLSAGAPDALYPLDALYQPALTSPSSEWEAMGYDRAFQEPAPSSKGPFPLLLVSTGWGPHPWAHISIGTRLASHGFVVAVLRHTGDPWYSTDPAGDHYALAMWNRPRDLSFVLTTLLERNKVQGDRFYGLIAPKLVAGAGWSAGGYAAIALASGDDTVWDYGLTDPYSFVDPPIPEDVPRDSTLPDPRFRVLVGLDAANQELRFEELARVKVPVMGLGEEWDVLAIDPLMIGWQARQHAAFSGHPSYRVDVAGMNHFSFSDTCDGLVIMDRYGLETYMATNDEVRSWFCEGVNAPAEGRAIITRYMLAFLKSQLLGEKDYQRMLTPGWALTRETKVEFFETEKRSPETIIGEWPDLSVYFWHQPGVLHSQANTNSHHVANRFMPRFR